MTNETQDLALNPQGFLFADKYTVSHAIAHALKRHGVECIFGQSLQIYNGRHKRSNKPTSDIPEESLSFLVNYGRIYSCTT